MIKYEFMRAHGKGSEGSEKRGGVRKKKGGAKKRGVHAAQAPPLCTPLILGIHSGKYNFVINTRVGLLVGQSEFPIRG